MNPKIAVEIGLENVAQELEDRGYQIINLDKADIHNVDAVVVSGEDNNVMDIANIKGESQIINARGLSALEVRDELESRLM